MFVNVNMAKRAIFSRTESLRDFHGPPTPAFLETRKYEHRNPSACNLTTVEFTTKGLLCIPWIVKNHEFDTDINHFARFSGTLDEG